MSMGRYGEAAEVCRGVLQKYPDYATPYSFLAGIAYSQKDLKQAQTFFSIALYSEKNWHGAVFEEGHAHTSLGVIWMGKREYSKAKDEFQRALDLNPNDNDARQNLDLLMSKHGV